MGIVQVRNIRNNRVYLTASANTPGTIMIQPKKEEFDNLKYHFGTSRWGGRR
jgi:hypothetical protein